MSISVININTILLFALTGVLTGQSHKASYETCRTVNPIIIDGKIDEAAWNKADLINFVNNSDGSPVSYKTEAKILYDDQFIYFAFHIFDKNINATKTRRDDNLWEEEVIEIFIQGNPGQSNYIELEFNPLGAVLDAYNIDSIKFLPFNSWNIEDLKWAVHIQGKIDGQPEMPHGLVKLHFP